MARYLKRREYRPTVAIIGEGITEHIYFSNLKQAERLKFALKPALPKHSSIRSIVDKAIELSKKEYDHIFCVFDLDEINQDRQILRQYVNLKRKYDKNNIKFIENNPCMEYWFLLHFVLTTREFNNYGQLEVMLKQNIHDYAKTERYLKSKDIYNFLKPHQLLARENAANSIARATSTSSKSEVHLILDFLGV